MQVQSENQLVVTTRGYDSGYSNKNEVLLSARWLAQLRSAFAEPIHAPAFVPALFMNLQASCPLGLL